jgi:heme/copper-type cytochrome/quinol oxidase subunit 4
MSGDTDAKPMAARPGLPGLAAAFGVLVAMTICELLVAGMSAGRAGRITALAGLLIAKVALVLSFFMQARASSRVSTSVFVAIGFAAIVAIVLMLESMFRVSVR